jgi:hypothetical protein
MIQCVYCNKNSFEPNKGSLEHVILSGLGGRKGSRNICCEACNNRLGDEIDKAFTHEMSSISNLVGIKTGRNKEAKTFRKIVEKDGRSLDLQPGGKLQYSKSDIRMHKGENTGVVNFSISAKNTEEAQRLIEQIVRNHGKTLDNITHSEITTASDYDMPPVEFKIQISEGPFFRSMAKMMLTYLSTLSNPMRLRNGSCKEAIDYINGIGGDHFEISLDYNTKFPSYNSLSKFEHKIFIRAEQDSGIVLCGLQLFGYLRFSAILSKCWNGGSINKCYIIDPVKGSGEEFEFDANDNLELIIENRDANESQFNDAFGTLYSLINEARQQDAIEDLIHTAITEFFASYDELVEENVGFFVETIMKHVQGMMFNKDVVQELTMEQLQKLKS